MTALLAVVLEAPVLRTPSAFAAHPDEFVPQIIPLEVSPDSLGAFASEQKPALMPRLPVEAAAPEPLPATEPVAAEPRPAVLAPAPAREAAVSRLALARPEAVRLRVPKWAGTGSLAILGGALSGLVIVATLGPSVGAAAVPTGAISITSEPAGLPVSLDNVAHGVTPTMAVVPAGLHHVQIGAGADLRERRLHVAAGGESAIHMEWPTPPPAPEPSTATAPASSVVAPVAVPSGRVKHDAPTRTKVPTAPNPPGRAEAHAPTDRGESARARVTSTTVFRPVPSGWLAVTSAFPVQVYENGVEVARDASGRLVLAAGTHSLTLANDALEFRQEQEVTIVARRAVSVALDTPTGVLHVNAQPWATVWVDGRRVGDTPIGNLSLPIGEHEVVLRHPNLGEERRAVTVGARTPVRVGVEFKP